MDNVWLFEGRPPVLPPAKFSAEDVHFIEAVIEFYRECAMVTVDNWNTSEDGAVTYVLLSGGPYEEPRLSVERTREQYLVTLGDGEPIAFGPDLRKVIRASLGEIAFNFAAYRVAKPTENTEQPKCTSTHDLVPLTGTTVSR